MLSQHPRTDLQCPFFSEPKQHLCLGTALESWEKGDITCCSAILPRKGASKLFLNALQKVFIAFCLFTRVAQEGRASLVSSGAQPGAGMCPIPEQWFLWAGSQSSSWMALHEAVPWHKPSAVCTLLIPQTRHEGKLVLQMFLERMGSLQ